jgi:glycosyltransferase involved in cell wall biosynthesis
MVDRLGTDVTSFAVIRHSVDRRLYGLAQRPGNSPKKGRSADGLRHRGCSSGVARCDFMSRPLVSVAIPCFNQARFLDDAIASVRRQRYAPVEVVVIDDGSTDDSAQVAAAAGVRLARQGNAGLSAARNAGLEMARGEYVVFLDADDELLPDAVGSGVDLLQKRPSISCVVRLCQSMDTERRPLPTVHTPLGTPDLYRAWLRRNFVWTPGAALFRTDAISAIGGFPVDFAPAADYAVYLTLARTAAVVFDAREVVRYRQHDGNMSRDPVLMLQATLDVLRRERRHLAREYREDFRAGVRLWREYYGEQIIERLRRERRARVTSNWQKRALLALTTQCPRVLARHSLRKLSRVLRGARSAPIEAGRFGPEVAAPLAGGKSSTDYQ